MSDIQRWIMAEWPTEMLPLPAGTYVTYADHVEALRQAEERGRGNAEGYWQEFLADFRAQSYEQGQRDALAAAEQRDDDVAARWTYTDAVWEQLLKDQYEAGQRDALAGAVQRVEALPTTDLTYFGMERVDKPAVIAAIKGNTPSSH